MFYNINKIIDIRHGALAMVQHSDLHVVPWHKPPPFSFGFNKVLMGG